MDLGQKDDHVNLLVHYMKHIFSYMYMCTNSPREAKPSNLDTHFFDYTLSAYWTTKKILPTPLLNSNIIAW